MELRHLRYLLAVIEEGSFTRAAARLHIAQPGISAQLKQLERELGQPLLDRTGRRVRLTAAGEVFLPFARAALEATASGAASVAALTGLVHGQLRLGTVATISSATLDLPSLLAGFHAAHPGVDIAVQEDSSAALLAGIDQGRIDAAFVGRGALQRSGKVTSIGIVRERLVAVMLTPPGGAAPAETSIAELGTEPLILPREGTGLRDRLDAAFAAAGVQPRIAVESGDPRLLVRLALAGLGTAVVPASVVARHLDPSLAVPALVPEVDGEIGLAWHRTRPLSPAAREFIAYTRHRRHTPSGPPMEP